MSEIHATQDSITPSELRKVVVQLPNPHKDFREYLRTVRDQLLSRKIELQIEVSSRPDPDNPSDEYLQALAEVFRPGLPPELEKEIQQGEVIADLLDEAKYKCGFSRRGFQISCICLLFFICAYALALWGGETWEALSRIVMVVAGLIMIATFIRVVSEDARSTVPTARSLIGRAVEYIRAYVADEEPILNPFTPQQLPSTSQP